jgi:hypothetical protein
LLKIILENSIFDILNLIIYKYNYYEGYD